MSEYYTLFSKYLNISEVICGGIKVGLLGFVIALVILIFFRKTVLIQRRNLVLTYISRSYFIFIPVICLLLGGCYGAIMSAQNQVIGKLPLYQTTAQQFVKQNLNIDININKKIFTNKSLDNVVDDTFSNIKKNVLAKLKLTPQHDQQQIQRFMLESLDSPSGISYIKSKLKQQLSTVSGIKRQVVNKVFDVKLSSLLTGDMIIEIMALHLTLAVNSILLKLMIIWAILLVIPLAETIFAYFYHKRQMQ
ncbi:hypothetical protein RHO13_11330 [Orbus wheelerorum]|uniref:hypothetical protein n=1 Tax=Orbus wheelerorum TaxID=3074111 RepID=UPI00370D03B3